MDNYNINYSYEKNTATTSTTTKLMRSVYVWMSLALLMTGLTALIVSRNETIIYALLTTPALMWGAIIAEVVLVFYMSARLYKMSFLSAGLLFALYAILNGVNLSFLLLIYTQESIAQTFFITSGTFAAMSIFGFITKKDLSGIGNLLIMALIGIIIATLVNIFMKSSGLAMAISYLGVIIFIGLTAYDTQRIKAMTRELSTYGVTEETSKMALMGSLMLYLDFINLFIYLLRILGDRR